MQKSLPGFTFTVVEDQGDYISAAIGEVSNSLIGGIVLAVFVLLPLSPQALAPLPL
jgi:multidrug efflux pump subunit AcrB